MKIAFTQAYYLPVIDGPGQVIHELAMRYVKQGHDVHVFCSDSDKYGTIKNKEEIIDGVKIHRCRNWFTIANFATFWPSVLPKLLKGNFDIIHSHVSGHSYVLFSAIASRIKKVPHIHTTHCCWTSGYRSFGGRVAVWIVYHTFLPWMFKWTDRIIAITPWEINEIQRHGGKKEKIRVIPNGMNEIFFKRIKKNNFRKEYGLPQKSKIALFFGRLNPTKGVDKLALAEKEILKARKDIHFVFLGPDEGMLSKLKEIAGDNKNFHILAAIRDRKKIAEMYQAADIYCLPSYREGLPLTMFEAMASGCPLVMTPVNGVPYEMKEPDNGLFVKYGNIEELKNAIIRIIDDKKLSAKMRKNNIKRAKQYDWTLIANRVMSVYKEVLGAKRKR
ncbi:MAG: glycosyltransferase family 4 protein [Candidatus Nanoarchaeia archaeon]|jgi:glycosyltransferase involved in cell wall biosynthesis